MGDEEATPTPEGEGSTPDPAGTESSEGGQPAELGEAGKKAIEAERTRAKAAEKRAKTLESQLQELQRSQMSDQERAIDEAKAATRAEVLGQVGTKVAAAEFKAAAAGRLDDDQLSTLLAGLDLKAFLSDDGDVDAGKIGTFLDGLAPAASEGRPADFGQGARSTMALNGDPLERDLKAKLGIR